MSVDTLDFSLRRLLTTACQLVQCSSAALRRANLPKEFSASDIDSQPRFLDVPPSWVETWCGACVSQGGARSSQGGAALVRVGTAASPWPTCQVLFAADAATCSLT